MVAYSGISRPALAKVLRTSSGGQSIPAKHLVLKSLEKLETKGLIQTEGLGAGLRIKVRARHVFCRFKQGIVNKEMPSVLFSASACSNDNKSKPDTMLPSRPPPSLSHAPLPSTFPRVPFP